MADIKSNTTTPASGAGTPHNQGDAKVEQEVSPTTTPISVTPPVDPFIPDVTAPDISAAEKSEVPSSISNTEVPASAETISPSSNTNKAGVLVKQYAIAVILVAVIGVGLFYALVQQGRIKSPMFDRVTALVMPVPTAVVVNGIKIPMTDYDKNKLQLEQSATQAGSDPKDPKVQEQIKQQALDVLINTELLREEASKAGVKVTQEQIDARYAEIVKGLQGEDKLQARMTELGITKESLLKDIQAEILIQTHLTAAVDTSSIKIDPKDIKAAYDQANTNPDSPLPPFTQVSGAIEAQLRQAKEQDLINVYIQKLRDAATIETKV